MERSRLGASDSSEMQLASPPVDRPFPYTNAQYIPQVDVTDDGLPPVPRAVAAQRHLEVMIEVKHALHLPAHADDLDNDIDDTSFYCVQMTINNENFQTDARRGSVKTGCKWYERFNVHLPESMLREARQAVLKGNVGPAFAFSLFDSGKYSAKSAIGKAVVPVKDILDVVEDGLLVSMGLQKEVSQSSGEAGIMSAASDDIMGADGQLTSVELRFHTLLANMQKEWVPPSVHETLSTCDERRIVLNPPRKVFISGASKGSGVSPERSIFAIPLGDSKEEPLSNPPEYHSDDEFQDEFVFPSIKGIDYHWRERLEVILDSLSVNLFVVVLVLIDLSNIIVFTLLYPTPDTEQEPVEALVLSILVIGCLLIELSLRQIAKGRRFWKSWFNIFDSFVVYLSACLCIARLTVPVSAIKQLQVRSRLKLSMKK